ncbi:MAG: MFS transporter [Myxococcota bacterium]|nr:MFS transporter [Myxococcota bacterium]
MEAGSRERERLPLSLLLLYGFPSFAGAAMLVPIYIHLPKFYSDVVGVPLGFLAIGIAGARALDALSDPLVGWLSDRTNSRFGRRRPYIALGAPLCAIAFYALFAPPERLDVGQASTWFAISFVAYFVLHTVYALPHYALGPELTLDYHERTRLFGYREAFAILGTVIAAAAPGALMSAGGLSERAAFRDLGFVFAIALAVSCWILAVRVKERPEFATRTSNPFVPGVRRALRNQPFRVLLGSYVVGSAAGAIPGTFMPFFNAYVIRPENEAGWLATYLAAYFGAGFLFLPVWLWAARRFGKKPTWLASFAFGISGGAGMFFLDRGDTLATLALIIWSGSSFGAGLFLGPSIQADVIDYDELHTGKRREAQYTAFWAMLPKFVAIPSAAIPIAVLATLGYRPNVEQTPEVVLAIRAIFALLPAFFSALAFVVAMRFPIDERAHQRIRAGIAAHARGESAIDPLTGERVLPPNQRAVDEDTGWFLDHFSRRELQSYLGSGGGVFQRRVAFAVTLALGVCVGASMIVASRVTSLEEDPGPVAVMAIVVAGFALAVTCYHLVRLWQARRLAHGAVDRSVVTAWLDGAARDESLVVAAVE